MAPLPSFLAKEYPVVGCGTLISGARKLLPTLQNRWRACFLAHVCFNDSFSQLFRTAVIRDGSQGMLSSCFIRIIERLGRNCYVCILWENFSSSFSRIAGSFHRNSLCCMSLVHGLFFVSNFGYFLAVEWREHTKVWFLASPSVAGRLTIANNYATSSLSCSLQPCSTSPLGLFLLSRQAGHTFSFSFSS